MIPFQLHAPSTLDEAFDLLERYGEDARPISGGTALILLMEQRLVRPEHVIALRGISDLRRLDAANGALHIGAGVPHRSVETSAVARASWPLLTNAYSRVATVRIRNVATVGGGLAHADPNQDPPAALIALNARVAITSRKGQREVAAEDLFQGYYETVLQPGELITEVIVPRPERPPKTAYIKFLPRTADDYPTVAVAVALDMVDGRCNDARIALNAAGPTPIRAKPAEDVLRGQTPTPELLRAAAATVPGLTDPTSDHRGSANYKRRMTEVFTRRALEQALAL
ncbi:MAG TPA: xanthine dehydrogenase family protein subunit M [Chloroflexota bacterium]|nr:xanthine dehydrogenase family protein subunit M [Chloroflexota bacterium]